jgi:hypothetical protein
LPARLVDLPQSSEGHFDESKGTRDFGRLSDTEAVDEDCPLETGDRETLETMPVLFEAPDDQVIRREPRNVRWKPSQATAPRVSPVLSDSAY